MEFDFYFQNQEVPVKMTAAAILREGHLYQKREYDEIKRLVCLLHSQFTFINSIF